MSSFVNLDIACAKEGKKISSLSKENLITNALAVLEEQGLYALFLFLDAKGKKEGKEVSRSLHNFLRGLSLLLSGEEEDLFCGLNELGEDIDKLLFARDLIRQALVYARYHAKATDDGGTQNELESV